MSRHALVVGGTRGLGRAVVRRLAASGRKVSVISRRPGRPLGAVRYFAADVCDEAQRRAALAGVRRRGPLHEVALLQRLRGPQGDGWSPELEVSLTATRALIESLAPGLPRGASIVLAGSVDAWLVDPEMPLAYHAAKAALQQMARFWAVTLGPRGIRVNAVSPATYLKPESAGYYRGRRRLTRLLEAAVPLGRLGTAAEVAQCVEFLLGPASSFVTGQALAVDGGLTAQNPEALARRLAGRA
jgi:NAD(P)-dependent dehydrogenase (short-subunit alcohol dehydrogenase family)